MSANPSQRPPDRQKPPSAPLGDDTTLRIRQMLKDLDTPLDGVPAPARPGPADRKFRDARKAHDKKVKQQHRKDLRLARRAARKVFKVKPSIGARRAATGLLTAGAVSVAAFTGPMTPTHERDRPVASYVLQSAAEAAVNPSEVRVNAGVLKASPEFKQALIEEEGVRYVVYRDVAGYPTVGVGHLIEAKDNLRVGDRVSKAQVLSFLETDLEEAEQQVRDLVGDLPLYQHEFDALVDLLYNVGPGTVSERKSPRLNRAIEAGDYEAIAAELDYTHAAGRVARGLEFRSERRAKIFLDAAYEDPRELAQAQSPA